MRHYYAEQSPRGFANEIEVHKFESRAERDAWVEKHRNDGDVNSASQGASACTADRARRILAYRGDAITESYNGLVEHEPLLMFAAYDDAGIWAIGDTPEAALAVYALGGQLAPDEIPATMRTAPMTYRLAEKVEREGYDYNHPGYSWRVLPDGTLDLDEGGQQ